MITGTKRKRLVLSCLECRRRKLKCNRELPVCSRCSEVGHPELCKYDERSVLNEEYEHEPNTHAASKDAYPQHPAQRSSASYYADLPGPLTIRPSAPREAQLRRPEQLENHIANLEARPAHLHVPSPHHVLPLNPAFSNTNSRTSFNHDASSSNTLNDLLPDPILIKGKGFKTRYRGPSNPSCVLSYFPTVYDFLKKMFREPRVLGTHKQGIPCLPDKSCLSDSQCSPEAINDTLKRLIPPEARCRGLMQLYFKHFESVYRIIHKETFWRQFEKLCSGELINPSGFTALLLAAMSCARCLYLDEPIYFEGDRSMATVEATLWIQAAEAFYSMQSYKHTTITWFQLPCLLLLSKRLNSIKTKRHFVLSQTLIATAVSAGLHRSPSALETQVTVYEQEMRRRLWATMTELELSCSIDWGVPSFSGTLFADCEPPGNLHDDDFKENTTEQPCAQPDDVLTDCSFQRFTHHLKPLRNAISNIVNHSDKHRSLTYTELLSYHQIIASKFTSIPSWTSPESNEDEINKVFLLKKSIELQLHQLLIILHLPFAASSESDPNKNHSRFVCVDSARSMLSIYERMPEHGFSQMSIFKSNLVRASLCICLLQARSVCDGKPPISHSTALSCYRKHLLTIATDPFTSGVGESFQIQQIEKAFNLIEERILRLGNGFKGFWILFAASCFIKANQEPPALMAWQKKVADRIIALFERISMCQKRKDGYATNETPPLGTKQLQCNYEGVENSSMRRNQDQGFDLLRDSLEILGAGDNLDDFNMEDLADCM